MAGSTTMTSRSSSSSCDVPPPSALEYGQAVQNPDAAFAGDAILSAARPVPGILGQPKALSGNFATVFQLDAASGQRWAVKCFTKDVPAREERYRHIHEMLHGIERDWEVPFDFLPEGIDVGGRRHPIVRMAWIDARTLGSHLRDDGVSADEVDALTTCFERIVRELAEDGIAHGDLQDGNILVDGSGTLRLVDYDGMFVPALARLQAAELGHPAYQSPLRAARHFDARLDRHSAWIVHTALRVRALAPGLFAELDGGSDGLVFGPLDLHGPFAGEKLERLVAAGGELRALAHDLVEVLGSSPDSTPAFEPPPMGAATVGNRCRRGGACPVCGGVLCSLCDRGAASCASCDDPTRREDLDGGTTVAWELGNGLIVHIGRRTARIDGAVPRVLVPDDDVARPARVMIRRYAAAHELPLDVGASVRRAKLPDADGPFEWISRGRATASLRYDPKASPARAMADAAEQLIARGEAPDVEGESASPLGEVVRRLRRRVAPATPGEIVVELEQEFERVQLTPAGWRWQRQVRTPDGLVDLLEEGVASFEPLTISDDQDPEPAVARAVHGGRTVTVHRVHRSWLLDVDVDGERSEFFVPHEDGVSLADERSLAALAAAHGRAGTLLMVTESEAAEPEFVTPSRAELVTRVVRATFELEDGHVTGARGARADDIGDRRRSSAGARDRERSPATVTEAAARRFRPMIDQVREPPVATLIPAVELVETWRGEGTCTLRYTARLDTPIGPPVPGGVLSDFTVDADGELRDLSTDRPCRRCGARLPVTELRPCLTCGVPATCPTCAPHPATDPLICGSCSASKCAACDPDDLMVSCGLCGALTCSGCLTSGTCGSCDPTTWALWPEQVPEQLAANRLRVLGRHDGELTRLLLVGPRRLELAVLRRGDVQRWITLNAVGPQALRLARRYPGLSDVSIAELGVIEEEPTAARRSTSLQLVRQTDHLVRWVVASGSRRDHGEIRIVGPPGGALAELPEVEAMFQSGAAEEPLPDTADLPAELTVKAQLVARGVVPAPDDRVELRLVATHRTLFIDGGGLHLDDRLLSAWEPQHGKLRPWSGDLELAALRAAHGEHVARLWRIRTLVLLTVDGPTGGGPRAWVVTGDRTELHRLASGVVWFGQGLLARVEAATTRDGLPVEGAVVSEVVRDPSGDRRPVSTEEVDRLAPLHSLVECGTLPDDAARHLSDVAYTRLPMLAEVPVTLGFRVVSAAGELLDIWPGGGTSRVETAPPTPVMASAAEEAIGSDGPPPPPQPPPPPADVAGRGATGHVAPPSFPATPLWTAAPAGRRRRRKRR